MSIEEAINEYFDYNIDRLYTALPAIVAEVNLNTQMVSVMPALRMKYRDGEDVNFAPILGVPLMFPGTSTCGLTFPVKIGDTVLLVFSQKNIETFKAGDADITSPADFRTFNIKDAVAIPGLLPFNLALNSPDRRVLPHSTEDVVLVHNAGASEAEVRIKPNGAIKLTSPMLVEINSPSTTVTGTLSVTGNISTPADVIAGNISLKNHKHSGVTAGAATTGSSVP